MKLEELAAGYDGRRVLQNVTLEFPAGQVTALIGPNGSGKSTLLRAAARLLPLERGRVLVNGADTAPLTAKEFARRVAYLPQSRNVPGLTAKTLVLHGRFAYLGYPRRYTKQDEEIAAAAMAAAGAAPFAGQKVAALSGGERQKVYLAMALAQDTPVLLLDEPTTYLDIGHQLALLQLCRRLAEAGKAVVLVLHELNLALRFADRVAVLAEGALHAVDTPQGLCAGPVLEQTFGVRVQPVTDGNGQRQYLFL